jgi:hypothetical protein
MLKCNFNAFINKFLLTQDIILVALFKFYQDFIQFHANVLYKL